MIVYHIMVKELKSYFQSYAGYAYLCIFGMITGWLFFGQYYLLGNAEMRAFFNLLPTVFLFMVPAVTMKLWAEERKQGTFELLMTYPVKDWEVVLGKFLGALSFLGVMLLMSAPLPVIVAKTAMLSPDWGPIIGGYLGSILLAGSFTAIGLYFSSLTSNQITALIMSLTFSLLMILVSTELVLSYLVEWKGLSAFLEYAGITSHYYNIGRGVIDTRDIVYFISLIMLFLSMNVYSLASRQWRG